MTDTADYLKELRKHKEAYADANLNYYASRAAKFRLAFRITGTLLIVASVSLPLLAQVSALPWIVSTVALVVAALSALNSFFGWQQTWEKFIRTQLALEYFIANWEVEMTKASKQQGDAGMDTAFAATTQLFKSVYDSVGGESQAFFSRIKLPEIKGPGAG